MDYIITGLAAGTGVVIGQILLMRMGGKHLPRPLEQALVSGGPEKARALLDAKLPKTKLIAHLKIQQRCERMAGLALLGDVAALEEENAMHRGSLVAPSPVGAVDLLGIAVRTAAPPNAAARLADLASSTEAEGGIVLAHVKKPIVSIAATPLEGCAPLAVSFSSSTGSGEAPYAYAWDFGDGATSTDANPTHEYATASEVPCVAVRTVTDGKNAVATASVLVTVGAFVAPEDLTPGVVASAPPESGMAPLVAALDGAVTSGNQPVVIRGDFGDGTAASTTAVSHTYLQPAAYTATCTATDADGDVSTDTVAIDVFADGQPLARAAASPTAGLAPLAVEFTGAGSGGDGDLTYAWAFGDGASAATATASHTYEATGFYLATLTVTDEDGDAAAATVAIQVGDADVDITEVVASASPAIGQAPLAVALDCTPTGGNAPLSYRWDLGDGTASSIAAPGHTYLAPGTYTATCVVTDGDGDVASETVTIEVVADGVPLVTAAGSPTVGLSPLTVDFVATASGGDGAVE